MGSSLQSVQYRGRTDRSVQCTDRNKNLQIFQKFQIFRNFYGFSGKKAVLGENREIFVKEVFFFVDFCLELEDFWVLEVNLKIFVVFEIFGFGGNLKILKGFA